MIRFRDEFVVYEMREDLDAFIVPLICGRSWQAPR